jgi:LPS-assembly lipoprotein
MSWSRRGFLVLGLTSLAGCGFHPLYAPRGPRDFDPELAAIKVAPIRDRIGQLLAQELNEQLNPNNISVLPHYTLTVALTASRADLGIQRDATSTRGEVTISATFVITDNRPGGTRLTGSTRAVGSFNIVSDAYAAQVAEDDTRERVVAQIADDLVTKLVLFVRQRRAAAAQP